MMQQINFTHTSTKKSKKIFSTEFSTDVDSSRLESLEESTVFAQRQVSSDYQLKISRPPIYI